MLIGRTLKQQGVHELKQNYTIDDKTKVLGVGSFGKVFMSSNRHNPDFKVAIKVLDKEKLNGNLELVV